jgi:hypothetical protein
MDKNNLVCRRDENVRLRADSAKPPSSLDSSAAEHLAQPRLYSNDHPPARLPAGPARELNAAPNAGLPHWQGDSADSHVLAVEAGTSSSSSTSRPGSAEQQRRNQMKEKLGLSNDEVVGLEKLEAAIKNGDVQLVTELAHCSRVNLGHANVLEHLLEYTDYAVVADAVHSENIDCLLFLTADDKYVKKFSDRMFNDPDKNGRGNLLDIAASSSDLELGIRLVEKGAKPGPNCPRPFLDRMLVEAMDVGASDAASNLLGYGADWNLFFYHEKKLEMDLTGKTNFLKPAVNFYLQLANKNEKVLTDILCAWSGTGAGNIEKFDKNLKDVVIDKGTRRLALLLKIRPDVVEAGQHFPSGGMMQAAAKAVSVENVAALKMLLDFQPFARAAPKEEIGTKKVRPDAEGSVSFSSQMLATRDEAGCTLLHLAAQSGNAETVALLLGRGANLLALDSKGESALLHAVKHSRTAAAVRILQAALAVPGSAPDMAAMISAAMQHADPSMRAALHNANSDALPAPKVATPPSSYAPHEDL